MRLFFQLRELPPVRGGKRDIRNKKRAAFLELEGRPLLLHYGNTAQFTADALRVVSLAAFPAAVTKMLANTQSIREHFCLTCQKTGRRDSTLRIVRYCLIFLRQPEPVPLGKVRRP